MPLPPNRWRDMVVDPLAIDSIHFMLFSRVPPAHRKPTQRGTVWYVEEGPMDLMTLRARERVLKSEGVETRILRCHVLPPELVKVDKP